MSSRAQGRGVFASILSGLDLARRLVVNLIFLFILVVLLAISLEDGTPQVPDGAALVLKPWGNIVEQLTGDPTARAIEVLSGTQIPETLLRDLQDAILAARDDDRIQALVLDLNWMLGAGPSKLHELGATLREFKESGKPVVATADFYTKSRYYLASLADEIYLHEMGLALLDGYSIYNTYYKEGIDWLEIDWNTFYVGEYKSAIEPYNRTGMSPAARDANADWLGDLWSAYLDDVAAHRNLTVDALTEGIEHYNDYLKAHGGQAAQVALEQGLVDHVGHRDDVRERLIELVGEDEDGHGFRHVDHDDYLIVLGDDRPSLRHGEQKVGVIVARGQIIDGSHPPGVVGGDSTAELIRRARYDDAVKALVLRVDSGGGSETASEVIRRELALTREAGKPVVVSMSSVAASGGYWISTASDQIWASPTTITGSIGIFGMYPTFQKPLAKDHGIRVDGLGTTWLGGAVRPDREMSEGVKTLLDQLVKRG